jgi:uncharacterized membrane protein (DUF373 family)
MEKIIRYVIKTMIVLLTVIMIYSMLEIVAIVLRTILVRNEILNFFNPTINQENLFIGSVQGFISAVLLITILIEVIVSLHEYQDKNTTNYIKVILEIAIIAVIRHILVIDYKHASSDSLIGFSFLILVLGLFYLVMNDKIKLNKKEKLFYEHENSHEKIT